MSIKLGYIFAICALISAAPTGAVAHQYKAGEISIGHPWTRATPGGAKVGGGYMSLTNSGTAADRLVGGSFEGSERVEIHEMKMDGGVMQMRPLPDGVAIAPGQAVKLEPGGYHLMFMGLKQPLKEGDRIKGTLTFEKAGKIDVEFAVDAIGGPSPHKQ